MSSNLCAWCKQELTARPDVVSAGKNGLCMGCLLTFLSGERPERRRAERRRYHAVPKTERRSLPDRRRA